MQAAPCPSPPTDADIATILKEQAPNGSWSATDDERGVMREMSAPAEPEARKKFKFTGCLQTGTFASLHAKFGPAP